jgi:hypothetical protein
MGYQRILYPKGVQTFERINKSKETKDYMKMEKVGVHPKISDDHYTKQ